jgi:hypothetical protein
MSTKSQVIHQSGGGEKLLGVRFKTAGAFPYNATHYWTVTVRLIRDGAAYGETVGSRLTLATQSIAADEETVLYDNPVGLRLENGDTLVGYLTSSGSPALLVNPSFLLDLQSIVR